MQREAAQVQAEPAAPEPKTLPAPTPPSLEFSERGGLRFQTMDDMWRFAVAVHKAGWGPKGSTPETNLVAIEMGAELGLAPMQAIQNIAVINGRPALWGDSLLALCMRSPLFDHAAFTEELKGTDEELMAVCTCARFGGKVTRRTFSVQDAKRAGLWAKSGPWSQYPKRMLQMRARAFALRDTYPDVLRGLYAREELPTPDQLLAQIELGGPTPATEPPDPPAQPRTPDDLVPKDTVADEKAPETPSEEPRASGEPMDTAAAKDSLPAANGTSSDHAARVKRLKGKLTAAWNSLPADRRRAWVDNCEGLEILTVLKTIKATDDLETLGAWYDAILGA